MRALKGNPGAVRSDGAVLARRSKAACWPLLALTLALPVAHALPVLPGAEGHGVDTPAGRGGEVYRVTSLAESGPGTLKACVDARHPRVCIFEVSGTITLSDDLHIRWPYITIAGQTAPAPGITLRGSGLLVMASHVLVQHIRVRPGDARGGEPPVNRDALKIEGPIDAPISHVVIDHNTFTWSTDEVASAWQAWDRISLLNNIFAEPLHDSIHPDGPHGFGVLLGSVAGRATIAGNLLANIESRNPMSAATEAVIVNNLIYNWGYTAVDLQSRGRVTRSSVVGNVFIPGPDTQGAAPPIGLRADVSRLQPGSKVFLLDNMAGAATADPWSMADAIYGSLSKTQFRSSSPQGWPAGLTTQPTSGDVVQERVLRFSGARPAQRDAVDARIVRQVRNNTGRIINCVAANGSRRCERNGGGYPELAVNRRNLVLPDNHQEVTESGYTRLEVWLHALSAQVEGREAPPQAPVLHER